LRGDFLAPEDAFVFQIAADSLLALPAAGKVLLIAFQTLKGLFADDGVDVVAALLGVHVVAALLVGEWGLPEGQKLLDHVCA
jgi:hypothetical protein